MKRDSFVFYRSFADALRNLSAKDRLAAYDALVNYGLEGETDASGVAAAIVAAFKPIIDANNRRYENGKTGGRPKKEKPKDNQDITDGEPNDNQEETKSEPNDNVNVKCKMLNDKDIKDIARTRARAKKTKPPDKWKPKDERVYDYDELENKLRGCYG